MDGDLDALLDQLEDLEAAAAGQQGLHSRRGQQTTRSALPPPAQHQGPVQPGSTPAAAGAPRFLAYNRLGAIVSSPVDDHSVLQVCRSLSADWVCATPTACMHVAS